MDKVGVMCMVVFHMDCVHDDALVLYIVGIATQEREWYVPEKGNSFNLQ